MVTVSILFSRSMSEVRGEERRLEDGGANARRDCGAAERERRAGQRRVLEPLESLAASTWFRLTPFSNSALNQLEEEC